MPRLVERTWEGDPGAMGGRKARASFRYSAYVPDPIADLQPEVAFSIATEVDEAETETEHLNARASVAGLEAIGPLLLRSEASASSRIEGYDVSSLNLARALVDPRSARGSARIVARNVSAMEEAIASADRGAALTTVDIEAIHGTLMAGDERSGPGRLRAQQNWIGGRLNSPLDAEFIPPPEHLVAELMDDLCAFMSRDDLPAVAQAAIGHAQFETIHPFADGNGRVGRCLIHAILRRRGVAPHFIPPVSVVLAARPSSYVAGLIDYREGRLDAWLDSFAGATRTAAAIAAELADRVDLLRQTWIDRTQRPRRDSAAAKLIDLLPALPVLSAPTARAAIGVSQQMTLLGLKHLEAAGVLRQISPGTYDRQFAATELFDLVAEYEARIAGR